MISSLNYFSSDMSLSNPDIQNHMIIDQDEFEYVENKENFYNNQYSNQQQQQSQQQLQYASNNSSLRSSPVNLRRSNSIAMRNSQLNSTERIPLQDLTELEESASAQGSMSSTDYFLAQQENQFFLYRQQQKKNLSSPSSSSNSAKSSNQSNKITRANLLR